MKLCNSQPPIAWRIVGRSFLILALGTAAVIEGGQPAIAEILPTAEMMGDRPPILWLNDPAQPVTLVTGRILTMDNDRVLLQLPAGGTLLIGVTGFDRDRLGLQPGSEVTAALVEQSFFAQAIVLGNTLDLTQVERAAQGQAVSGAIDSWSRTSPDQTASVRQGTATVQAGTVQTRTVQTGTVQTGTVQTGTVQTGTVQTGTVRTSTVLERRTLERREAVGCATPCVESRRSDGDVDCDRPLNHPTSDRAAVDDLPEAAGDCWVEVQSVERVVHPAIQPQPVERPAPPETHAPVRGLW